MEIEIDEIVVVIESSPGSGLRNPTETVDTEGLRRELIEHCEARLERMFERQLRR